MNNFEILILSLALVFTSQSAYFSAGVELTKKPLVHKVYYTGIMFLTQFIMAGAGIWIGIKFGSAEVRTNMLISLSILLLIGLKEVFSGIRSRTEEKDNDVSENKATFFAALAEGITASAIGLSIGLLSLQPYLHWFFIGAFIFTGIITSMLLASRMHNTSAKFRLQPVGGLLLLAAAIKLAINLTGF